MKKTLSELGNYMKSSVTNGIKIWFKLLKILIPISIGVKAMTHFGLIALIGQALEPIMGLVGLPGVLGIVWAVAMFSNLWAAAFVFASLFTGLNLTTADATVLSLLILIAHALPLELKIVQKCGIGMLTSFTVRIFSALLVSFTAHKLFTHFSLLSAPIKVSLKASSRIKTY